MWAQAFENLAGGVLWADATTDVEAMLGELDGRWATVHHRVTGADTKDSLIDAIGVQLDFPEWAGRNLDALYDLLTELTWLADDRHVAVVLDRGTTNDPPAVDGWQQIVQVLIDAAQFWRAEPRIFVAVIR